MTSIQPVIVAAGSQLDKVAKLVNYCRKLDGTEMQVIVGNEGTWAPYPHCNNFAFHQAAVVCKGHPFLWMEPDAIPLKTGWVQTLEKEYHRLHKEFMLSSDSHPPGDLVGGIGIYGPNTHWLIPEKLHHGGWDGWMIKNVHSLIGFTPLIQHKYGFYEGMIKVHDHLFPRDNWILRRESVIFHRDSTQSLIP